MHLAQQRKMSKHLKKQRTATAQNLQKKALNTKTS